MGIFLMRDSLLSITKFMEINVNKGTNAAYLLPNEKKTTIAYNTIIVYFMLCLIPSR
jgi:hypothetical protein